MFAFFKYGLSRVYPDDILRVWELRMMLRQWRNEAAGAEAPVKIGTALHGKLDGIAEILPDR